MESLPSLLTGGPGLGPLRVHPQVSGAELQLRAAPLHLVLAPLGPLRADTSGCLRETPLAVLLWLPFLHPSLVPRCYPGLDLTTDLYSETK